MSKGIANQKVTVNPDLAQEREKCTFNPLELTNILDGGPEKTEERRKTGKHLRWGYIDIIYTINIGLVTSIL